MCEADAEASPRFAEESSRCLGVDWRDEISASGSLGEDWGNDTAVFSPGSLDEDRRDEVSDSGRRVDADWRDEVSASGSRVDEDWRDEVPGTSRCLDEESCNMVSTSGRPDEQSRTEIACPGRSLEEARCKEASATALPVKASSSSPGPFDKASTSSVRRDDQVPSEKLEE